MLEESEMSGRLVFNIDKVSTASDFDAAPPSLPATGEVCARITGVRKLVTNYETYIVYEIETVVSTLSCNRHASLQPIRSFFLYTVGGPQRLSI